MFMKIDVGRNCFRGSAKKKKLYYTHSFIANNVRENDGAGTSCTVDVDPAYILVDENSKDFGV